MKTFFKVIFFVVLTFYASFYGWLAGVIIGGGVGIAGYRTSLFDYLFVYGTFFVDLYLILRFVYKNRKRV